MEEKFVFISVLPETREDLRRISKLKDTNIYKVVRDLAQNEKKKILDENNTSVNNPA